MALYVRDGKISKEPEKTKKPFKIQNRPYGIALSNDFFFLAQKEGDFDEFIKYLQERGLKESTIDLRFYQLRQLKRECGQGFSVERLKANLATKSRNTRNTMLGTLRSYAKYRANQGKWDLMGVMLVDPELRQRLI